MGYAVWRCVEGIADPEHRGNDARAVAVRSSFVVRGAAHLWLAFGAIQATLGHPSSTGGTQSRQATATVFRFPKGDWVVLVAAVGIGGFGAYQVYKSFAAKLHRHVNEREVTDEAGGWLIVVSRIGIAARGVVFMAIGAALSRGARAPIRGGRAGIADAR
jgi:hypothetical protein